MFEATKFIAPCVTYASVFIRVTWTYSILDACRLYHNLCFIFTTIWMNAVAMNPIDWIQFVERIFSYHRSELKRDECKIENVIHWLLDQYLNSVECVWVSNWIMVFGWDERTLKKTHWRIKHTTIQICCIQRSDFFFSHRVKTFITFVILGIFKLICSLVNVYLVRISNGLFVQRWWWQSER